MGRGIFRGRRSSVHGDRGPADPSKARGRGAVPRRPSPRPSAALAALGRPLAAALILTTLDAAALVGTVDGRLTASSWSAYAALAVTAMVWLAATLWALASAVARALRWFWPDDRADRVLCYLAAAATFAVSLPVIADVTAGRQVKDAAFRWPVVVLIAGFAAAGAWRLGRWTTDATSLPHRNRRRAVALLLLGALLTTANVAVLPRLYPSFHFALAMATVLSVLVFAAIWPSKAAAGPRRAAILATATAVCLLSMPLFADHVADDPGLTAQIDDHGPVLPWVRRVLSPNRNGSRDGAAPAVSAAWAIAAVQPSTAFEVPDDTELGQGPNLAGRDLLLITVDALRADRLTAYGGDGLTPAADALATDGAVFLRAYSPTPHTSYALTGLLTGRDARAALQLGRSLDVADTLAAQLGRHGYHTVAFYPPAVFHVDGERFAGLVTDGFGFSERTVFHASAMERVAQAADLLQRLPVDQRLFLWVHLFEPHEPYDPPAAHRRGDSAEERYDGEVSAADAAVGRLVDILRRERPRTVVIMTADHGEEHGEHGGYYHGTTLFDEQIRVPLILNAPAIIAPGTVSDPVTLTDVAPTVLALFGVPTATAHDGRSFAELIADATRSDPSAPPRVLDASRRYAFASLADERMVTDGRFKLLCRTEEVRCRLYDLVADPDERSEISGERSDDVRRLRTVLAQNVRRLLAAPLDPSSQHERTARVLARASLGDPTVGAAVLPLLASDDAAIRRAALEAVARLHEPRARRVVLRLAQEDPEAELRIEAAITAMALSDAGAVGIDEAVLLENLRDQLAAWLRQSAGADSAVALRAALALASRQDSRGETELLAALADSSLDLALRGQVIASCGELRLRRAVPGLVALLSHLELRTVAAAALGRIGDRRARRPLMRALEVEPYLTARQAEATALVALGEPRVIPLLWRHLAASTPLPRGVGLLIDAGALERPSIRGAQLARHPSVRRGTFVCDEHGCAPGPGAMVVLPGRVPASLRSEAGLRVVVRTHCPPVGGELRLGETRVLLRGGDEERLVVVGHAEGPVAWRLAASPGVEVMALVVVGPASDRPE